VVLAFILTLLAGLATIVGGFIGIHRKMRQQHILAIALGFAAGAMLCVSFIELIPEALRLLMGANGMATGLMIGGVAFAIGALFVALIEVFLPCSNSVKALNLDTQSCEGYCHGNLRHRRGATRDGRGTKRRLLRSGMMLALIMGVHNFPEGIVTFAGAMHDVSLGLTLALAIALHNIPEGISIAAPIYAATGNKIKALGYTTLSALAEPLGAVAGYVLLRAVMPEQAIGIIFAAVSGMMIYISFSELVPAARSHATHIAQPILGTTAGTLIMASSLLLLIM